MVVKHSAGGKKSRNRGTAPFLGQPPAQITRSDEEDVDSLDLGHLFDVGERCPRLDLDGEECFAVCTPTAQAGI